MEYICNSSAKRFCAPQTPLTETETQDATIEGALANKLEGLQYGSPRQPMAEDCLFAVVYALTNETETSMLLIMFFIQGGGFSSNSNGNFNGTRFVEASGVDMIVVRINYRVGILGFIVITAARYIKQHATKFGGNPDHIMLSGDSAGGNAIDILLAANNGEGFPDLFVDAAAESTGDSALANNLNSTGCLSAADPIDCMRMMPIAEFQNKTTTESWGPTIDGNLIVAPHYQMFEQGRFQNIPVIYGYASNEATPDFISNQSINTYQELEYSIRNAVDKSITGAAVTSVMNAYPASINEVSFFGRNVAPRAIISLRQSSGTQWQQDAAIKTEMKQQCVGAFFSDMFASVNQTQNYAYRYNILDETPGGMADQGLFSPHTSELYALWGKNDTDRDPLSCTTGANIAQTYFISFMRSLNPNTFRLPGSPERHRAKPYRINEIVVAGLNQRQRYFSIMTPLSKRINVGLGENQVPLPTFANGTRADPMMDVTNRFGTACKPSKGGRNTTTVVIIIEDGSCHISTNQSIPTSSTAIGSPSQLPITSDSASLIAYGAH
ncbi:Alpha/Beta hydrolase protein [Biscogniauxia mediterranea]|nr:Alpha/Beta hydrolase protein [Biscogniauxia mediterranea]